MTAPGIRNYLRALGADPAGNGPADADLIARFAATRDEAAFELLVWRHAPLVQAVCRAVLRDHHAAEDAAQATFLVLAKKAATFANRGSVVGWLYRVARRVSVRLAKQRAKLPASANLDHLPERDQPDPIAAEYAKALCAEVDRLPERYRVPVLLCFFEGLTHAEAARRTGWPIGTVAGRLSRAKELLARRLSRRGVALGAVALPVAAGNFVGATAQAATAFATGSPVPLVSSSVLTLAQGAIPTMTATLFKLTAASAAVVCAVTAAVWGFAPAPAPAPAAQEAKAKPAPPATPAAALQPAADPKPEERVADARQRARSGNNLKQLMIAMHNYHDAMDRIPGDITDKNGKPLLSWRVAILPYIEQEKLYKQFKLDEPWDSENNKKLLAQMPPQFRTGFEPKDTTKTHYQVFAGSGTPFEPGKKITFATIADGTSNTLGIVEAGPPVEWTKPADIAYDPKKAFPKLEGPFKNVLIASLLDGSVFHFKPDLKGEEFRKFVERADGQVVDLDAAKADLKAVSKEDKQLLATVLKENAQLASRVNELLAERAKLLGEGGTDLDRMLAEHEDLKRQVEELKQQIEELKRLAKQK
jgi:RNA polymerase sigma factor (sigma-70 family)